MPSSRAFVHESRRFLCSCIRLAAAVCSALCWCIRLLLQLSLACACALICVLVSSPVASLRRKTVGRILPTGPVRSLSTCGSAFLNTPASERACTRSSLVCSLSRSSRARHTSTHTHTTATQHTRAFSGRVWLWRAACALLLHILRVVPRRCCGRVWRLFSPLDHTRSSHTCALLHTRRVVRWRQAPLLSRPVLVRPLLRRSTLLSTCWHS